jgi:uncharacterized protein
MEKPDKQANNLQGQTSPYLLQHLYNPVDWYPWGDAALEKARQENKPLLVSIGYSACHWCHVMERESFEDEEVARLMNKYYVCVKVDREERPDIDHLYMNAVQLISGHGGWPLNCFALPDGRPFWGGTYFPREQWVQILTRVAAVFANQHDDVVQQAESLTRGVAQSSFIAQNDATEPFSREDADRMYQNMMENMDRELGGTRNAPKFPVPVNYEFLLHYYHHTGRQDALEQVLLTLRQMAMGGIYDQLGGGFARYSVDEHWKVPHFEKMLYDNAQLISLYSKAWKVAPDPMFRDVVYETIAFVQRELSAPNGVFYAALDADSEGEEGLFYIWKEKELDEILGEDAPLLKAFFHVGGKGFWEKGRNILLRTQTHKEFAEAQNISLDRWLRTFRLGKEKLMAARDKRQRPGLDNKVLVSWNGLMIKALADAYAAFGEMPFLVQARHAAGFILEHAMEPTGKLFRLLSGERPAIDAYLEDYAHLIRGLIRLYEVSKEPHYLKQAHALAEYVMKDFGASDSSLFSFSSAAGERLAAPFFEFHDNVIPSSNSVMAANLFYLSHYFEKPEWARRSREMLRDLKAHLSKYSSSYSNWGILLLHHVYDFYTLVVAGPDAPQKQQAFFEKYLPNTLMAAGTQPAADLPVFNHRFRDAETWIYVCSQGSCQQPVQTPEDAMEQME